MLDIGKTVNQMEKVKHNIKMEIIMKVTFKEVSEAETEYISSIEIIDMKVNGEIIASMAMEDCFEVDNYFLKASFKMD